MTKQGLNINFQKPANASVKISSDEVKKRIEDSLKKSYENSQTQKPRTFIEMNQGYIIIGVVLVSGYFVYKKIKK
jgi:hypothetical protein